MFAKDVEGLTTSPSSVILLSPSEGLVMLDMNLIRRKSEVVREALKRRGMPDEGLVERILSFDEQRRRLLTRIDELRHRRKELSKEIGRFRAAGEDAGELISEVQSLKSELADKEKELRGVEDEMSRLLLVLPNIPDSDVPDGVGDADNKVVREPIEPREFDFAVRPHYEVGERLGILNPAVGASIAGSHFPLFVGAGARLCRALVNIMLDTHTESGYTEILPPFLANRASMLGTGQLPKFEDDMYRVESEDMFLIPTGEVPLTSLHRDSILSFARLPLRYVAYTPCFRREAGAKTRGLLRVHQFDKVELMVFATEEQAPAEHQKILQDAETILQKLKLPYRVVLLCAGELGFAARKCYDLELWAPGVRKYLEVSSVSHFGDFQARRLNIRYRRPGGKLFFCHTLNGSGLALPRLVASILENYQNPDGSVTVPEALRPYMGGMERIEPGLA